MKLQPDPTHQRPNELSRFTQVGARSGTACPRAGSNYSLALWLDRPAVQSGDVITSEVLLPKSVLV